MNIEKILKRDDLNVRNHIRHFVTSFPHADNCIQINKDSGDEITFTLKFCGDIKEEKLWVKQFPQKLIDDQESSESCNFSDMANDGLDGWLVGWINIMFFIQACGYTAKEVSFGERFIDNIMPYHYGFNEPTSPSNKRILLPKGVTKEEELENKDEHKMSFGFIDRAVEIAKNADPQIRPIHVGNKDMYVIYLYPTQVDQLRATAEWKENKVGEIDANLFEGSSIFDEVNDREGIRDVIVGVYKDVILCESLYVTNGVKLENDAPVRIKNVRRAVLLGAQSVLLGCGSYRELDGSAEDDKNDDKHKRVFSVTTNAIIGMKKARIKMPDGSEQDYGTIVIPTYVGEEEIESDC
ncbi:DUF4043 family protein [Bartonella sp. cb54]|uniref:phage capsid family protein n=1 Tax=Bartonella sp. cb54 TaxID=3385560 RepID=UPI0039A787A4